MHDRFKVHSSISKSVFCGIHVAVTSGRVAQWLVFNAAVLSCCGKTAKISAARAERADRY